MVVQIGFLDKRDPQIPREFINQFTGLCNLVDRINASPEISASSLGQHSFLKDIQHIAEGESLPVIQDLAKKVLGRIDHLQQEGAPVVIDFGLFLQDELLARAITNLEEDIVEPKEGKIKESACQVSVVVSDGSTVEVWTPSQVSERLPVQLQGYLKSSVFSQSMEEGRKIRKAEIKKLDDDWCGVSLKGDQVVTVIMKPENTITMLKDAVKIEGFTIFRILPSQDTVELDASKGTFCAVKMEALVPLKDLENEVFDDKKSNVTARYYFSEFCDSEDGAKEVLERMRAGDNLVSYQDVSTEKRARDEVLSILKESRDSLLKPGKGKSKQLFLDLDRKGALAFKSLDGSVEVLSSSEDEEGKQKVIKRLQGLLGGERNLSLLGELLTQTAWANPTQGLQTHYQDFAESSASMNIEEGKALDDEGQSEFLAVGLEDQEVFIEKIGSVYQIENGCLIRVTDPITEEARFFASKVITQAKEQENSGSFFSQSKTLVSRSSKTKEEAKEILALLHFQFLDEENVPSSSQSAAAPAEKGSSTRVLFKGKRVIESSQKDLETRARGPNVRELTRRLGEEYKKNTGISSGKLGGKEKG